MGNRYNERSDSEKGEYEEQDDDELHQWYDAAGVGEIDFTERVKKVAAPLTSANPLALDSTDIVSAAKKAAQVAAIAASEHRAIKPTKHSEWPPSPITVR